MSKWTMLAVAVVSEALARLALRAALDHWTWPVLSAMGCLAAFSLLRAVLAAGLPVGVAYGIWSAPLLTGLLFVPVVLGTMDGAQLAGRVRT
jgi:small multidrug resistance pump